MYGLSRKQSKTSYSINVKKSINSADEALFQYVNRASGRDNFLLFI